MILICPKVGCIDLVPYYILNILCNFRPMSFALEEKKFYLFPPPSYAELGLSFNSTSTRCETKETKNPGGVGPG